MRALLLALGLMLGLAGPAWADPLDEFRRSGAIAERADGLTAVQPGAPEAARALSARVNEERLALYRRRAAEQGVTLEAVGAVYAAQIRERAPAGTQFVPAP